jgi:hypothetical protein
MNERIKEMWEESTGSMFPRPGSFTAGEYDYHLEKFAELIVRECITIADEFELDVNRSGLVERIKKHFGVEE